MADVGCAGILVEDTFCGPFAALPAAGTLLGLDDMPVRAGGCAANVAINLAKQGLAVDIAGCVGADSAGNFLLEVYDSHGIGRTKVRRVEGLRTSRCIILLVQGQDRRYLYVDGANRAFEVEHISHEWLKSLKVFYLGGLFGLRGFDFKKLAALLAFCRSSGVRTVVDVIVPQTVRGMDCLRPLLPLIDVFVPNEDEARAFTGLTDPGDQLREFERAGARTVIVTCGGEGAMAIRDGRVWACGAYQMEVVDPSGSGDAFTVGVIRGLLLEWELPRLLRYASAVGASVTRTSGTTDSVFSPAQAEAFIAAHPLAVSERH